MEQIAIVFALGTHRAMTDDEIVAKIGAEAVAACRVINLSVHDDPDYASLGRSEMGIPVWMLREVVEADLRVGIGSIVPHCDVGYSGGGKILLPGVCSSETVAVNHTKGLDFRGRNMLGAATTIIREDIEDVVSRVGLQFIANSITRADGALYRLVCGDFIQAHRAGVPFAQDVYGVPTRRRADITICSSHPGDVDFIQVAKSVWSGDKMTRPGGDLIVVTPCVEGIGPYPMLPGLMAQDRHSLERRLRGGDIPADTAGVMAALAVRLNRIGERVRIRIVSDGLSKDVAEEMGLAHHDTAEEALRAAQARQGRDVEVSVMTHGGYTYPMVEGES
jgi:nickel-dependent lactate racemase